MTWQDGKLKNPLSGKLLKPDSAHSLSDGDARFPVIAEIPFLRVNRDELRTETLQALDLGDERAALTLLLQDQDDWAKTAPPDAQDLQPLFDNPNLTLRSAMQCLKYGAVADYFAYRWSDPTYLSGLALLEHHLPPAATRVFELCCGIGHYLREFELRGLSAIGMDVVFSKLWLARKYVSPKATLVCADANFGLPFVHNAFNAAFCHDAFYFLPNKFFIAEELKRVVDENASIIIGHAHNNEANNLSSGAAVSVNEYAAMFDDPILFDDSELTASIIENRAPQPQQTDELKNAAAIAVVQMPKNESENDGSDDVWCQSFSTITAQRKVQINPLLWDENRKTVRRSPLYPSERYEQEYGALSGYLILQPDEIISDEDLQQTSNYATSSERFMSWLLRRIFLDLPEDW